MAAGAIDRRVAKTRRLLQEALFELTAESGYAMVTVENICGRADVGRSTFYAHYPDKDSLRKAAVEEHIEAIREAGYASGFQPSAGGFAFSGAAFVHADATRMVHRAMIGGKQHEIPDEIRSWISKQVRHELMNGAGKDAIGLEVATRFVTGAFFEVLRWWLDAGTGLSPAAIDHIFQRLAIDGVRRTFATSE